MEGLFHNDGNPYILYANKIHLAFVPYNSHVLETGKEKKKIK